MHGVGTLKQHRQCGGIRRQRGATAVEFSIVFSLLFGIFWAIISYAMPFFLYQTMSYAATDAARHVLRVAPEADETSPMLTKLASDKVNATLSGMLPAAFLARVAEPVVSVQPVSVVLPSGRQMSLRELVVSVRLRGPYNANPLVPQLRLPGVGRIPDIPGDLRTEARIRME